MQFRELFPVVICDSSTFVNLAFRMTSVGFLEVHEAGEKLLIQCFSIIRYFIQGCGCVSDFFMEFVCWSAQLQDEASLTLKCMEKLRDGGFEEIFMTKIDYPVKYDHCIR